MRLYIAVLLLFATPIGRAADEEITRRSLRGLKGVAVLVESLKPEVEANGLTRVAIQTDVELKLRQTGIPVLDLGNANAVLDVAVSVITHLDTLWPYVIEVQLLQDAALVRDPSIVAPFARSWHVTVFGYVGKDGIRGRRDDVKDQVDQFINAYLAANPKK
jgi:hypothetical protein